MKKIIKICIWIVLLVLLVNILRVATQKIIGFIYPLKYENYIEEYSNEYGLDKYFVMAVIKAESNYNTKAHSGVARGLMQLTESTAEWLAEKLKLDFSADDIEDAKVNIRLGCCYLRYLEDKYKDDVLVLAAYNAGPGNVAKWLEDEKYSSDSQTLDYIPFGETRRYIEKVERYYSIYKKLY